MRRITIAGAGGFIGSALRAHFEGRGDDTTMIGRREEACWSDPGSLVKAVEGTDVLINLAGKSVNCRYTDANRTAILRSRVATTRALREAVARCDAPPALWINASTATIYRHEEERANTERQGVQGEGFSVDVARAWEEELFAGELPATRRIALRMAIVLGDGPATSMLLRLARWGLAGPQFDGWAPQHGRYRGIGDHPTGDGRVPQHRSAGHQKFSWIHIDDVAAAIEFAISHPAIEGPVNLAAPVATDNRGLMRALRRTVGAPFGLPSTRWMLEPVMWLLRSEPELLLKSRWVAPQVLCDAGFDFAHVDIEEALRSVAASASRRG